MVVFKVLLFIAVDYFIYFMDIVIGKNIVIRADELVFRFSRSGGPGGQNVNKVNTRVMLFFDVCNCQAFSEEQKQRIIKRLRNKITKEGVLRIVSQEHRTQAANRAAVVEKLRDLLMEAIKVHPVRKKRKIPYYISKRRLEEKRKRSLLKKQRAWKGEY